MTTYNSGLLTSKGWSAWTNDDPQTRSNGLWSTATRNATATASNAGGFVFNSSVDDVNRKRVARTGYTDRIEGGKPFDPVDRPDYGIWLKPNTVVDMGPVAQNVDQYTGNQVEGYGKSRGIVIGAENLLDPFTYDSHSGVLKGGEQCFTRGFATEEGGIGIANYGIIDYSMAQTRGITDSAAIGVCASSGGVGLLNWGSIRGGARRDFVSGRGDLAGLYNSADLGSPTKDPVIMTRGGVDYVTGDAPAGNNGIYNDGLIDMGAGKDFFSSYVIPGIGDQSFVNNYFGGSGRVVMGRGNDVVRGYGDGEFWGGRYGVADSVARGNRDRLELVVGLTYVISEISTTGKGGRSIDGFSIVSGERTMNVFGFDTFGTNDEDQIALAAGTYSFPSLAPV